MDGLHNIDGEFEADSLAIFFDWYDDHFVPTFLQSDSPISALQDPNLMENFNFQTEIAPVAPSAVMESVNEAQTQVQPTYPTSWFSQGPSSEMAFIFVPNPLPPPPPNTSVLNGTQLNNPLSCQEGSMLEEADPSSGGQDVTQTGCSNLFADLQNENLLALQGIHFNGEQNLSNQVSVPNTREINNFNGFNVNQSSPNTALVHPNPTQARPGNETYSSELFVPLQRPASCPLQNHISDAHAAWNSSRSQYTEFSSPDIYGAEYAPNYMQSFTTLHNQVGHSSELQYIPDLQSQNSIRPVNQMYPGLESYSNLDPAFVTMPQNPYQQGCGPLLPEPAVPSAPSLTNYGQQSSFLATNNFYGSGPSVPPTNQMYYPLYENQNQDQHQHLQFMMPNDQGQQSGVSMQQWTQGVPNHISNYNQRMNTSNLQRPSNTSSRVTEASSSRASICREAETAPVLRIQDEEATIPKKEVRTNRDKRNLQQTSSSRSQPSEAIRRILNMNPSRWVNRSISAGQIQSSQQSGRVRYEPPSRGRPPKRRYDDSYFQREKWHKVSSEIGNAGTTPTSQQAQHIPGSYQNAMLTNLPSAPRQFVNSVYDIEFERRGHPIDPHLRFFKRQPEN